MVRGATARSLAILHACGAPEDHARMRARLESWAWWCRKPLPLRGVGGLSACGHAGQCRILFSFLIIQRSNPSVTHRQVELSLCEPACTSYDESEQVADHFRRERPCLLGICSRIVVTDRPRRLPFQPAPAPGGFAPSAAATPAPAAGREAFRDLAHSRDLPQPPRRKHVRGSSVRLHPADGLPPEVRLLRHAARFQPGRPGRSRLRTGASPGTRR